jgi:hypothetical protein
MKQIVAVAACALTFAGAWVSGCSSDENKGNSGGTGNGATGGARAGAGGNSAGGSSAGGAGGSAGLLIGGDAGGADSGGPDGSCGLSTLTATPRQVSMLLVIDKSYSMTNKPTGFSTDKWTAMKSALQAAVQGAKSNIDFGLELFPVPSGKECGSNCCQTPTAATLNLPVEDGITGAPKIDALMNTLPGGATPTAAALQAALSYFTTGAGAALKGDRYVLLATDGGPNCNSSITCADVRCTDFIDKLCTSDAGTCCAGALSNGCLDDVASTAKVKALASAGVQTFVVGIPGSEAYEATLNSLATAGGRAQSGSPKYYAVNASGGVLGLTAVLQSITRQLLTSCRLQLASAPPDLGLLNVDIDGQRVLSGANGWRVDASTSPATIVLQGSTCARVETIGVEKVQVVYGCPTERIE